LKYEDQEEDMSKVRANNGRAIGSSSRRKVWPTCVAAFVVVSVEAARGDYFRSAWSQLSYQPETQRQEEVIAKARGSLGHRRHKRSKTARGISGQYVRQQWSYQ